MQDTQKDGNSHFKLAQLWHTVNHTHKAPRNIFSHNRMVNEILKDDFDVNHQVTIHPDRYIGSKIHLQDCTALHFLYYEVHDIYTFNALLDRGADFTIKNRNGRTPLHLAITDYFENYTGSSIQFINSMLSAHVKFQNSNNPRDDKYGVSHLHGACITDHVEAVELFLDNGASIEEASNFDSPWCASYNPLYFAAYFYSFRAIKTLVERGANVNPQSARGMSPLDLLIGNKRSFGRADNSEKESILEFLLEKNAVSTYGVSSLQIACTFKDLSTAERLLDQGADIEYAVPLNSPVGPGNTALHFAANNSVEAVKMLLKRGARLDVEDSQGLTPVELCMSKYSLEEVCTILSCTKSLQETRLSDGETRLLDVISSMRNLGEFKLFLKNEVKDIAAVVPSDSALWPGNNLLHLAVTFSKEINFDKANMEYRYESSIIEECLKLGLNVNVQNIRGQTPIHLAFKLHKVSIVRLLFQHLLQHPFDQLVDVVDEDNLSYLHIACQRKNESVVQHLLRTVDPNIVFNGRGIFAPGSTPSHATVVSTAPVIAEMLLRHGAKLHATDGDGLTPIHWLINLSSRRYQLIPSVLFAALLASPEDCVVDSLGLSYLHIACLFCEVRAVEKLLDLGSNINAVIKIGEGSRNLERSSSLDFLRKYLNFTPLQMAARGGQGNEGVLDALLRRGADMFLKERNSWKMYAKYIPVNNEKVVHRFFCVLWDREDMQKSMEQKLGLTKLHIACYMKNEEAVRNILNDDVDVNAQINVDSEMFPGCTPLHLLIIITSREFFNNAQLTISDVIRLLVDCGADGTIANTKKDTPVHVLYKQQYSFIDDNRCKNLLLNAQQDFSVNPVNTEGISHFHLACRWHELEVIGKFLQNGSVNVNGPVDCFSDFDAGCTPLHLALSREMGEPITDWTKLSQIVDLLLKHGANVALKDVHGDTPLHKPGALLSPQRSILDKLTSCGGDMKSKNVRGQTPFEELMLVLGGSVASIESIMIFQLYGYKINSWNYLTGEGYIAKVFMSCSRNLAYVAQFKIFVDSPDGRAVDSLHNAVALFDKDNRGTLNITIYTPLKASRK